MISEPEMPAEAPGPEPDGGGAGGPVDLLSDDDRPAPPFGSFAALGRRPWVWAIAGVLASSAVWATVLPDSGHRGGAPDLHGYHLRGNPCGGGHLKVLTDSMGAGSITLSAATVSRGPALDQASCHLSVESPAGDGWVTNYTLDLAVELHKKTDPRAEFDDADHAEVSQFPGNKGGEGSSTLVVVTDSGIYDSAASVHPVSGLGDSAYLVAPSRALRTLEVLHGGAVLTLGVYASTGWVGPGAFPSQEETDARQPDLGGIGQPLEAAMRDLMSALAE